MTEPAEPAAPADAAAAGDAPAPQLIRDMPMLTFNCPPALVLRLEAACARLAISRADGLRRMVRHGVGWLEEAAALVASAVDARPRRRVARPPPEQEEAPTSP